MGLDMYLYKKIYVGGNYEHRRVEGVVDISVRDKKLDIPLNEISTITLNRGYWRKANHIHKWFVDNVQEGVDDCRKAYVTIDNLKELKKRCEKVLSNKKSAPRILPKQAGFFFGNEEYDEWYFQDIEDTIKIIDRCLDEVEKDSWELTYYYESSW